jgi:hypothetical protein
MQELHNKVCVYHSPLFIVEFLPECWCNWPINHLQDFLNKHWSIAAAEVATPRTECALKIEMFTAASATMLGRGFMVGQTNLSPFVNRSKDGFSAKGGQAGVGCRGETSPF